MTDELYKKVLAYINDDCQQDAMQNILAWFRSAIWHDVSEKPKHTDGDFFGNQILVFGIDENTGPSCSVCSMINEETLYAPVTEHEYKWGKCPFTKWAYIADLITSEMYQKKE